MKIGILGHFGHGKMLADGQTVKTRILENEISEMLDEQLLKVDTHEWRKKPFGLFLNCIRLLRSCDHILILPAHNGVKIFIPLFVLLNYFFGKSIHYIVIGGWLPEMLKKHRKLIPYVRKLSSIHVESYTMIERLNEMGIKQTHYLPNFKRLNALTKEKLVFNSSTPYKLCTFSRVTKEKGIEDAIAAVVHVNEKHQKTICTLDIYGAIEESYKKRFEQLVQNFQEHIDYKGVVAYDQSVEVLKEYFLLLFPTYYSGEGFAGTLLDAFASGVPVLASDWRYNEEIVKEGVNGYIFALEGDNLQRKLEAILENPTTILKLKTNCLEAYKNYDPQFVVPNFLKIIISSKEVNGSSLSKL